MLIILKESVKNMEEKENRRVTITKRMLKDALIEMLRYTDIHHVSIRDLCKRADVNRSTFYKHYTSQFDLLSDMEKDLLTFLSQTITEHETQPIKIMEKVCIYLENNLEFGRLIINNNIDPAFPQRLFSLAEVRGATINKNAIKMNETMMEYLYNYINYGSYKVLCDWLSKEQREPTETIARFLVDLIQHSSP